MTIKEIEREINERKAAEKAKHEAEIQRLADETDRRMRKEEAERQKAIEAEDRRREAAYEKELNEEARALFYSGNAGASDAVWQSVRDEFRKLIIKQRAAAAAAAPPHTLYRWDA
jgi:hypothetical protein